jgi:hypothetical protein
VGVSEGRHENFSSHFPLKATLLDPVATCFNDLRKCEALHQGNILGFPILANDEGESGWLFRQNPHRSHIQWDVRRSEIGKMFRLGERGMQEIHERGRQSVNTGNQWVTQMEWGFRRFFFPAWTALL